MEISSTIMLSSGHPMPIIGIGTCLISKKEAIETTLTTALNAGCRFIDTAYGYMNQHLIGEILKEKIDSGVVKREDLFIVDKLPNNGMKPENVKDFFTKSAAALQVDYIDLYLIHSPISTKHTTAGVVFPQKDGVVDMDDVDLSETWKAMESLVKNKLVRSIGLTNFNSKQIQLIYDGAEIKPCYLEVECHVYLPQHDLLEFCKTLNISLTGNCPLGKPNFPPEALAEMELDYSDAPELLKEKKVVELAKKHKKSPAQILLRYLVQRGIVPIPQSVIPASIEEYMQVFDFVIDETGMASLKSLQNGYRFIKLDWKGMKEHPQYPFHIPF